MPVCEKCERSDREKDDEAIEVLAKIVAQEFSGVHYSCVGKTENVDKEIARKAFDFIRTMVSAHV